MIEYINKKSDEKVQAVKIKGVKFQDFYFRPCVGLNFWIRWGRYCIDLRPICKYLKIELLGFSARTQEAFEKEIQPLIKKLPCDLFLMTVQDAIHAYKKTQKTQKITSNQEDNLSF